MKQPDGFRGIVFATFLIILFVTIIPFSANAADTPLGYPWSSWGEISESRGGREHGFKLDGYTEQGVDWFRINNSKWILNTFGGIRVTVSDETSDFWNNKAGILAGIKIKRPVKLFSGVFGEIAIGVRGEQNQYFSGLENETRGIVFFQWWVGGNWKRQ